MFIDSGPGQVWGKGRDFPCSTVSVPLYSSYSHGGGPVGLTSSFISRILGPDLLHASVASAFTRNVACIRSVTQGKRGCVIGGGGEKGVELVKKTPPMVPSQVPPVLTADELNRLILALTLCPLMYFHHGLNSGHGNKL